ncbi:hypothetical protein [Aestuariivita boseongensis]|uniref:hypothetical protein n=1 Tax=Aestuariivita boseongensis TaxID=1470562 RepID=UPI00067FAB42|nr:hypothetical protein [Aestuariivita boseongensis]
MRNSNTLAISFTLLMLPTAAWANAGLPMMSLTAPLMVFSLLPVIIVEASFLTKILSLAFGNAVRLSGIANLASMLIGVPLTWLVLVILQGLNPLAGRPLDNPTDATLLHVWETLLNAPWIGLNGPDWKIPLAMTLLLVPYFLISWFTEFWIVERSSNLDRLQVKKACLFANTTTYLLMVAYVWAGWSSLVGEEPWLPTWLYIWAA